MSNLNPILIIPADQINALSTHASVADADKAVAGHGEGQYLVVRIVHPVTVEPPPQQGLKVVVGEGFIKKPNARGPRKAKTPAPPVDEDPTSPTA